MAKEPPRKTARDRDKPIVIDSYVVGSPLDPNYKQTEAASSTPVEKPQEEQANKEMSVPMLIAQIIGGLLLCTVMLVMFGFCLSVVWHVAVWIFGVIFWMFKGIFLFIIWPFTFIADLFDTSVMVVIALYLALYALAMFCDIFLLSSKKGERIIGNANILGFMCIIYLLGWLLLIMSSFVT